MRQAIIRLVLTAACLICKGHAALAADTAPAQVTAANQGTIDRGVPRAQITARPRGSAMGPAVAAAVAPAPTGPTFAVRHIRFEGNQRIAASELAAVAAPYEGRDDHLGELQRLAHDVQQLYHQRGYFLARVVLPPQELDGGDVRIVIYEGRVESVKVTGNKHYSERFVQRFFEPALRSAGGVARQRPIERALLIENEFLDLSVKSTLRAGVAPGTAQALLSVHDRAPIHADLSYDNFGNPLAGRNHLNAGFTGGNALTEGDLVGLHVVFPFPSASDPFYSASYSAPLGDRGDRLGFQYSNAVTSVGGDLAVLDIRGKADIFGLILQHPILRTLSESTNFSAGLVAKSVKNFVFTNVLTSNDQLRELVVSYDANTVRGKVRTLYSGVLTQGLGTLLGGVGNANPLPSRAHAGDGFAKLNFDAFHIYDLSKHDLLFLHGTAQLASNSLPTAELIGLGGVESVRGFLQSEFLGDEGYTLSAEIRHAVLDEKKTHVQLAAFVDQGGARVEHTQPGEIQSQSRTGAGVGVRAGFGRTTSVRMDLGFPLHPSTNTNGEHATLYAQIASRW